MPSPKGNKLTARAAEPVTEATNCIFLDLPPEVRNQIYELVYPCACTVELLDSDLLKTGKAVPSKALPMTCRQVYEEGRTVHRAVWDGTEFTITVADKKRNFTRTGFQERDHVASRIRAMEEWRLERVSRVRIRVVRDGEETTESILRDGVWTCGDATPETTARQVVPIPHWEKTERAQELGFKVFKVAGVGAYRFVDVTGAAACRVEVLKKVVQRRNLRKEELVAMVRKVAILEEEEG